VWGGVEAKRHRHEKKKAKGRENGGDLDELPSTYPAMGI